MTSVAAAGVSRTGSLHDLAIITRLVVCVIVMLLVMDMARKAIVKTVAASGGGAA